MGAPRAGGALFHHTRRPTQPTQMEMLSHPLRSGYRRLSLMRHKSGAPVSSWTFRGSRSGWCTWGVHVLLAHCTRLNFYAFMQTVPDAARSRDLSSQHGLSEAIKTALAVSVVFPPFDVQPGEFLWKPNALVLVEVKPGLPRPAESWTGRDHSFRLALIFLEYENLCRENCSGGESGS